MEFIESDEFSIHINTTSPTVDDLARVQYNLTSLEGSALLQVVSVLFYRELGNGQHGQGSFQSTLTPLPKPSWMTGMTPYRSKQYLMKQISKYN